MIFTRDGCSAVTMDSVPSKPFRKFKHKWVDSRKRFHVLVSKVQSSPPWVKIDITSIPPKRVTKNGLPEVVDTVSGVVDDLYLFQQESIELNRINPHTKKKKSLDEAVYVQVQVEEFWSATQSGGNHGRPVRRGSAFVSGSSEAMRILQDS